VGSLPSERIEQRRREIVELTHEHSDSSSSFVNQRGFHELSVGGRANRPSVNRPPKTTGSSMNLPYGEEKQSESQDRERREQL